MYPFQIPLNSEMMQDRNRFDMSGPTNSILPISSGKLSAVLFYTCAALSMVAGT